MGIHPLSVGLHTATLHGTTIQYRVAGRGPVLVVQPPGWGIGPVPYETTLTPLEREFTIVYVRPRGASGAPQEPASKLHVGQFVLDLEALRAHLGLESFSLTGHSHGGLIAMNYALQHPKRVSHLLLLAPQLVGVPGHPGEVDLRVDPADEPEIAKAYAHLEAAGGFGALFDAQSDAEASTFLAGFAALYFKDPRHRTKLQDMVRAAPIPVATMQAVSGTDGDFALDAAQLRGCQVRTLAMSGRFDIFCPPSTARHLVQLMPNAAQAIFEDSGHFPWIEEPAACFAAMRGFLAEPSVIPAR